MGKKSKVLKERQAGNSPEMIAYADRATDRVTRKYYRVRGYTVTVMCRCTISREQTEVQCRRCHFRCFGRQIQMNKL